MIRLYMTEFPDKTAEPICLEVHDKVYVYGDEQLFEKLNDYIGYKIEVKWSGNKTLTKNYVIHEVSNINGIPHLDLRD